MKYLRPATLLEAVKLQSVHPQARLLAGGTDLMVRRTTWLKPDATLIDIKALPELQGLQSEDHRLWIGALTTVETLRTSPIVRERFPALAQAGDRFAGLQIRHRATLGGNLVNASPAGDLIPPLYVYQARVHLASAAGSRTLAIVDFFRGPGVTARQPDEILTGVTLPYPTGESAFFKVGNREAMAISVVNGALRWEVAEGRFRDLVVAAGAVAPTVVYCRRFTSALLEGRPLAKALEALEADIAPIDDLRASAWYRRRVLARLLED
ncbi:MAG: xanthine dehydrogenase family protein subunit M, partial [Candidatus Neomarinimicrobiota bacterium]